MSKKSNNKTRLRLYKGGMSGRAPESYGGAVKDFTSVEEAEKAGLPSGTKITINGRSATVE